MNFMPWWAWSMDLNWSKNRHLEFLGSGVSFRIGWKPEKLKNKYFQKLNMLNLFKYIWLHVRKHHEGFQKYLLINCTYNCEDCGERGKLFTFATSESVMNPNRIWPELLLARLSLITKSTFKWYCKRRIISSE